MPGLEVFLPQVKHHLGSILAPEAILGDSPEKPLPFHISLGRPLLQWRPVQHLFLFWRLLCGQRDVEEIDMIFGSAFMWGSGSFLARERFLGTLRASRKVRWGILIYNATARNTEQRMILRHRVGQMRSKKNM